MCEELEKGSAVIDAYQASHWTAKGGTRAASKDVKHIRPVCLFSHFKKEKFKTDPKKRELIPGHFAHIHNYIKWQFGLPVTTIAY